MLLCCFPLLMLSNRFYNRRRDKQVHCLKWLLTSYNRFLLFLKGCPDEEWHQIQIKVCQFWLFTNKQTPHSKIRYLHMLKCYMYIYFLLNLLCLFFLTLNNLNNLILFKWKYLNFIILYLWHIDIHLHVCM